jgi:transposase-like protein
MISRYMRYTQSEKMEIIHIAEDSKLSVRKTLRQIGISRSTFYEWYKRYQESGFEGQNPRVLQENMRRRSSPQSGHRMRANPHIGLPQSRDERKKEPQLI